MAAAGRRPQLLLLCSVLLYAFFVGGVCSQSVISFNRGDYTYKVQESTGGSSLWTTPVSHRVLTGDTVPTAVKSGISLSAAKNEYEPFQIVLSSSSGSTATVTAPQFGIGETVTLQYAKFTACAGRCTGSITNRLSAPFASGATMPISSGNNVLWVTVRVPQNPTATGTASSSMTITIGSDVMTVPVSLYVFNFLVPVVPTFLTGMNLGVSSLATGQSVAQAKAFLFDLRMTPTSVGWPGGLNYPISWDNSNSQCTSNPTCSAMRCQSFIDESQYERSCLYEVSCLAVYLLVSLLSLVSLFPLSFSLSCRFLASWYVLLCLLEFSVRLVALILFAYLIQSGCLMAEYALGQNAGAVAKGGTDWGRPGFPIAPETIKFVSNSQVLPFSASLPSLSLPPPFSFCNSRTLSIFSLSLSSLW
jgi:hypothetical protein